VENVGKSHYYGYEKRDFCLLMVWWLTTYEIRSILYDSFSRIEDANISIRNYVKVLYTVSSKVFGAGYNRHSYKSRV
jgi:hypothetical protein